jgi:hypothetical protein
VKYYVVRQWEYSERDGEKQAGREIQGETVGSIVRALCEQGGEQ